MAVPCNMARTSVVVATGNSGKLREFQTLLAGLDLDVRSLAAFPGAPDVAEEGTSFAAIALDKARAYARHTRAATLADDSGLEVDALAGAPGIRSARYAGPAQDAAANIEKLLAALEGVAAERRTARFRCAIAVVRPDGAHIIAEGTCEGRILDTRRGVGGFGYDPVFLYPPAGRTFAEMRAAEKDAVSHRARAMAALRPRLAAFLRADA